MSQKIFITRLIPQSATRALETAGQSVFVRSSKKAPSQKELIRFLKKEQYTVLVSFLTDEIGKAVFDACPTLRLIANYAVGYNNIDIDEARRRGIIVTNTQGTSGNAVAEFTIALMLSLSTRLVEGDRFVRAKKYKGWDPYLFLGTDMQGKTVGLIGTGEIGTLVAKKLIAGFECRILYTDVKKNETLDSLGAVYTTKEDIFAHADIVSLHVPLLPETTHLINKETLSLMKKDALLINTARGPVVDEYALMEALQNGTIGGGGT